MEVLDYSIFPDKPVVYARFWTRFAAVFIDSLILLIPTIIVRYVFSGGDTNYTSFFLHGNSGGATITNMAVGWLYDALQESGPGMATIGKKAMRIKVTNFNGERITFGQATGRHFGKYISILILGIGYLMMLWDERRQTLHDRMAGTFIVQE